MSGVLHLVNPRKRRKARAHNPRKRRTAAQVAATRRLVALNRAKRSSNPVRKLRRKKHTYRAAARRHNPIMHHVKRYVSRRRHRRHNPISVRGLFGHVMPMLKAGAIGAGGALTVDLAMGYIPWPAAMVTRQNADGSTNYLYFASKAALAIALGTFGKKVFGRAAETMGEGSLVVNLYDLFRTLMPAGLRLGYFNPAMIARSAPGMAAYIPGRPNPQMAAYVPGSIPRNVPVAGKGAGTVGLRGVRGSAFTR